MWHVGKEHDNSILGFSYDMSTFPGVLGLLEALFLSFFTLNMELPFNIFRLFFTLGYYRSTQ
jgi:hypothetical protein